MMLQFTAGFAVAGFVWWLHVRAIHANERQLLRALRDGKAEIDEAGNIGWVIR